MRGTAENHAFAPKALRNEGLKNASDVRRLASRGGREWFLGSRCPLADGEMELRDQLQAALGGAYTVQRELTRGGMSRVFVATETALDRTVVIKVISPELAAGVSASRFAREIRLAASLQQANIVPLLSSGEAAGLPYYTMPFVDGLSLRDRLNKSGALGIPEAISVLRDVARALAYAHERGVVHRDIKPDNVLLSGGAAVVTDFGIAKAISVARTESRDTTITQAGSGVGTPAYMSPEQAAGDPGLDHRADVYAFGCLAYELLTGETPFHGRPLHQLLTAHFAETAPSVTLKRADTPPGLAALVARCLEKNPADRPQSGATLLERIETDASSTQPTSFRPPRRALVVGAAGAAAVLLIGAGAYAAFGRGSVAPNDPAALRVLAVLPFANVGGDSAQEYFADGLTDELATALGKVGGIQIAARSSAYQYKGRDVDARKVGRALGAGYVVQGSVRREGDRIRVATQLTRSTDNKEIWQDSYPGDARNVFALEDTMIKAVTAALASRLGLRRTTVGDALPASASGNQGTANAEAHDAYMRARFFLLSRRSVPEAANLFQKAIDKDSTFARAFAGLAETLEYLPYYNGSSAADLRPRVETAANRALMLDSSQAEAHLALGLMHAHAWEWDTAGDEFRRAVALDPGDPSAHTQYARYLITVGRPQDAIEELRTAQQLDPVSGVAPAWMISADLALGRYDEALAQAKVALEIDSTVAPAIDFSALAYASVKRYDEAMRLQRHFRSFAPPMTANLAFVFGQSGRRDSALRLARELEQRPRTASTEIVIAFAYLGIKDTARAFDALERATALHAIWPSYAPPCDPQYDFARSSPRFAVLIRRVGLDEKRFTSPQACRLPPP
jgi:TolB-like protein/tetratricopeptide (TPR) repeat protein/tRNA A-37 threonylcarbamoyl transferase component Bud32